MKIAFFDTETTGLEPGRDEVIELCARIWDSNGAGTDQTLDGTFYRLWLPQGECSAGAAAVNGYTKEAWIARGAKPLTRQDMIEFEWWLEHHKPDMFGGAATHFDVNMLKGTCDRVRVNHPKISHRQFDLQALANPLVIAGKIESVSLAKICEFFGVVNAAPHTARGDIDATIECYERLVGLYWPALGVAA